MRGFPAVDSLDIYRSRTPSGKIVKNV